MRVAVILPAYNEELTVGRVIEEIARHYPRCEVVVVDNASTDATQRVAAAALKKSRLNGRILFEARKGKAMAVRRAFFETEADIYVMMDADLTYPAASIGELIRPVAEGRADMVVGDRHTGGDYLRENRRIFHGFGNRLVTSLIRALFGSELKDIMSGFRAFNRRFVKNYPMLAAGFELETDLTLHALDKRFRVAELPIRYVDRPAGSFSKLNTYTDGLLVIKTIINIFKDYRPMVFFGMVGAVLLTCALAVGSIVIAEFLRTQYITHVPSAILATGLSILAILSFSIGLVIERVARSDRFFYELSLLRYDAGGAVRK